MRWRQRRRASGILEPLEALGWVQKLGWAVQKWRLRQQLRGIRRSSVDLPLSEAAGIVLESVLPPPRPPWWSRMWALCKAFFTRTPRGGV
jgi:hypothetical protein